jgi:thiol:disulfide interchange protein DsbD
VGLIIMGLGIMLWVLVGRGGGDMLKPLAQQAVAQVTNGTQIQLTHVDFSLIKTINDLDNIIKKAAVDEKIVMLDFYADWCISCKELEKFVFGNPKVAMAMGDVVALQADVTKNDAEDKALMKRFNIVGPPGILFFRNGKEVKSQRIVGEIGPEGFLEHLNKI